MRTATIVPIYPNDYQYALNLLNTFNIHSSNDLYFIFSNTEDYELFQSKTDLPYKHIIVDEELILKYPKNIINIKKFYGMQEIIEQYDYVGIFDSETIFVKKFDTDEIYPKIFNDKILKSNISTTSRLIRKSAELMGLVDNERLKEQTEDYRYYWWFNEICVYERESFIDFMKYIHSIPTSQAILNERDCFDYILYGIWLICFRDFSIKKYFTDRVFIDGAIEHNNEDVISIEFNSHIDHNKNHEISNNIKAIIQLDH